MSTIDTSAEAVERLLEGVTPGPWFASSGHVQSNGQLYWQVEDANDAIMQNQFCWTDGDHAANARFIASARDLVPALVKERDALRAKLDEAVEAADYLMRVTDDLMQDRFHPLIDVRLMVGANAKIQSIGAARATLAKIKGADHE